MTPSTTEALKIVAENEWQLDQIVKLPNVQGTVELSNNDAKTLFAAIKQLSGEVDRLPDHMTEAETKAWEKFVYERTRNKQH